MHSFQNCPTHSRHRFSIVPSHSTSFYLLSRPRPCRALSRSQCYICDYFWKWNLSQVLMFYFSRQCFDKTQILNLSSLRWVAIEISLTVHQPQLYLFVIQRSASIWTEFIQKFGAPTLWPSLFCAILFSIFNCCDLPELCPLFLQVSKNEVFHLNFSHRVVMVTLPFPYFKTFDRETYPVLFLLIGIDCPHSFSGCLSYIRRVLLFVCFISFLFYCGKNI